DRLAPSASRRGSPDTASSQLPETLPDLTGSGGGADRDQLELGVQVGAHSVFGTDLVDDGALLLVVRHCHRNAAGVVDVRVNRRQIGQFHEDIAAVQRLDEGLHLRRDTVQSGRRRMHAQYLLPIVVGARRGVHQVAWAQLGGGYPVLEHGSAVGRDGCHADILAEAAGSAQPARRPAPLAPLERAMRASAVRVSATMAATMTSSTAALVTRPTGTAARQHAPPTIRVRGSA